MATFNGMSIIVMPGAPAAPSTIEYTAQDIVAVSISPFTGQQQVQDWQASFMEASVSLPALTNAQAQAWIAFLMALRGQANVFQLGDPLLVSPAFAVARESFRAEIAQLLFPAVQNVCVDFTGAGYLR